MRLLARVVGAFFILFGLGFLLTSVYLGTYQDSVIAARPRDWRAVFGGIVLCLGFCTGGLYLWKVDADASDNLRTTTSFTKFLATHRRGIQFFAWIGFVVSVGWLAAACVGANWHLQRVQSCLELSLGVLFLSANKIGPPDPERSRAIKIAERAFSIALFLFLPFAFWQIGSFHIPGVQPVPAAVSRIVADAWLTLLYGLGTIFFSRARLRSEYR